ncbi:MAG TPA: oligoribonuclease [Acidimicrobiia bacterium]|nr:oligoribonuclease [Acidimicrobiia bacterium]
MSGADVLVWMDLEMTGLDVERDVIVEIAALATTATTLEPLDGGLSVVVAQPPEVLGAMSDFVRRMHERSGLLTEITSGVSLEEAGRKVLEYIKGHVPTPRTVPLCGNSIGMDRRFLARYLPDIEEHLHYRSIDVSSIKELCRRWYPEPFAARPQKTDDHRALPDIGASISELRYYRETVFK